MAMWILLGNTYYYRVTVNGAAAYQLLLVARQANEPLLNTTLYRAFCNSCRRLTIKGQRDTFSGSSLLAGRINCFEGSRILVLTIHSERERNGRGKRYTQQLEQEEIADMHASDETSNCFDSDKRFRDGNGVLTKRTDLYSIFVVNSRQCWDNSKTYQH